MPHTTVQVSRATRRRLAAHKASARQPYDEIINRALDALDVEDLELSDESKAKLAAGRRDAKAGRVYSTKQLLKELGLGAPLPSSGRSRPAKTLRPCTRKSGSA